MRGIHRSRWIPHTKASDADIWCFFDLRLNKRLNKQSWGWWFETLSRPFWRHRNEDFVYSPHGGFVTNGPVCLQTTHLSFHGYDHERYAADSNMKRSFLNQWSIIYNGNENVIFHCVAQPTVHTQGELAKGTCKETHTFWITVSPAPVSGNGQIHSIFSLLNTDRLSW